MNKEKVEILVADDEPDMRALLASVLRGCGFPFVHYASNGLEAVKLIEQKQTAIRIAFLDISMPGKTGIEVIKAVKAIRPPCYCVIVSAHSDLENVKSAMMAGARGFIVKPYNTKKVVDVLDKIEKEWV